MTQVIFKGKTKAYKQFSSQLRRTRSLIDLGVVGIDKELQEKINPLIAIFADAKGITGPRPKEYKPNIKQKRLEGKNIQLEMDDRSSYTIKKALEFSRKQHDELRYFHYSNLAVAIWAAFETYNATLFEQLYREKPELLKSSELVTVQDIVDKRDSIMDFLIERQLENVGHLKLRDVVEYYKKRFGVVLSDARYKKLEKYYFLKNVVAHKTGLIRPIQKIKVSSDFYIVGDEIRVSKTFLINMVKEIENTVKLLEKQIIKKFY